MLYIRLTLVINERKMAILKAHLESRSGYYIVLDCIHMSGYDPCLASQKQGIYVG